MNIELQNVIIFQFWKWVYIIMAKKLKRYVIVAWTLFLFVYSRKLCFYNLFHKEEI